MRKAEGGQRESKQCSVFYTNNKHGAFIGDLKKFHPIFYMTNEWENDFIKYYDLRLPNLYYKPFNFSRTGCKGCPFALDLEEQLDKMKKYLPNEYKQCLYLWGPVYDEYKRINFRLHQKD